MGLDMMLFKYTTEVGTEGQSSGSITKDNKNRVELGYWRKANAVHNWFVENCQDGIDDCNRYFVTKEQIKELLSICEKIKAEPYKTHLLPTVDGFFFGSTDYDDRYYYDIDLTIQILVRVLIETNFEPKLNNDGNLEKDYIYYVSSW